MNYLLVAILITVVIFIGIYLYKKKEGYIPIEARHPLPINTDSEVYLAMAEDKKKKIIALGDRYDLYGNNNV